MASRRRTQAAHPAPFLLDALKQFREFGMRLGDKIAFKGGWVFFEKDDVRMWRRSGFESLNARVDGALFTSAIENANDLLTFSERESMLVVSYADIETAIPLEVQSELIEPVAPRRAITSSTLDVLLAMAEIAKKAKGSLVAQNGYVYALADRTMVVRAHAPQLDGCPQFRFDAGHIGKLKKVIAGVSGIGANKGFSFYFGAGSSDRQSTVIDFTLPSQPASLPGNEMFERELGYEKTPPQFWTALEELAKYDNNAIVRFDGTDVSLMNSQVSVTRQSGLYVKKPLSFHVKAIEAVKSVAAFIEFTDVLCVKSGTNVGFVAPTIVGTVDD